MDFVALGLVVAVEVFVVVVVLAVVETENVKKFFAIVCLSNQPYIYFSSVKIHDFCFSFFNVKIYAYLLLIGRGH